MTNQVFIFAPTLSGVTDRRGGRSKRYVPPITDELLILPRLVDNL